MSYGCTIAKLGYLVSGISWVEKALAINPSNERARRNLHAMKMEALEEDEDELTARIRAAANGYFPCTR